MVNEGFIVWRSLMKENEVAGSVSMDITEDGENLNLNLNLILYL